MAAALLVGLGLNKLLGWWWADDVGALALLYWLIGEAREAYHYFGTYQIRYAE